MPPESYSTEDAERCVDLLGVLDVLDGRPSCAGNKKSG